MTFTLPPVDDLKAAWNELHQANETLRWFVGQPAFEASKVAPRKSEQPDLLPRLRGCTLLAFGPLTQSQPCWAPGRKGRCPMLVPRLALRSTLLALGVLVCLAPGTLAVSSYQTIVMEDACTFDGGAHGLGYVRLKVKVREVGMSGANSFRIQSMLQWRVSINWTNKSTWPAETSSHFEDDSITHYRIVTRQYDYTGNEQVAYRIKMKVQFWSDSDGLLMTKVVTGTPC